MSLLKSSATIGIYTLISRVFGFLRDVTIAATLGAGWLSDAFFVAFKLPNFMRRLFAEGAFNSAFVPLYAGMLAKDGEADAKRFAQEVMSVLIIVLLFVTALFIIFMPWLMWVLAPGFADEPEKFSLTILLTQITMPYMLFISLVSLLGGILNSINRFAAVAATPIIMNLCLILIPFAIDPWLPTTAHSLSIAVTLSGVAQFLWLVYFCRKYQVMPRWVKPVINDNVKKLLNLMAPAALGAGVVQINLMIDIIIGSHVAGGVSYLYYADRINELPLAVIGIAVGTVLLPMLSKQIRENNLAGAHASQNRAIELSLLFAVPAAAALMVIAEPIVKVLYERGEFTGTDTAATYATLMAFALGLPAFVLVKVLAPGFFANQDTKTPFKIAVACVFLNLVLNLSLIGPLKQVGLALSTSIAGWVNAFLMATILSRRGLFVIDQELKRRAPRMLMASALMAGALYYVSPLIAICFEGHWMEKTVALTLLIALGMIVYGTSVLLLRATDTARIKRYLRRQ